MLKSGVAIGIGAIAGCIEMGGNGGNDNGNGDEIDISIASFQAEGHNQNQFMARDWVDKVNEKSDEHELNLTFHPGGSVGGPGELYDLAEQGAIDMGYDLPAYTGGEMPLSEICALPGVWEPGESASGITAYHEMCKPGGMLYEHELSDFDIIPMINTSMPEYTLHTIDTKVTTMDDIDGLVVRSAGGYTSETVKAIGGTPEVVQTGDIYSSLDQGIVDADVTHASSLADNNLHEVLDYTITNINLGGISLNWFMNQDYYENLPSKLQDTMWEAADEVAAEFGPKIDEAAYENNEEFFTDEDPPSDSDNVHPYETPVADEIHIAAEDVWDLWVSDVNEAGYPGDEVLDRYLSLTEEYN